MKLNFCYLTHFLSALFLICFQGVIADEVSITTQTGKPVIATFPDGRIAELKIDHKALLPLKIPFGVTENECTDRVDMACEFRTTIGFDTLTFSWIKNSDATKISQPLVFSVRGDVNLQKFPLQIPNFYGTSERVVTPKISAAIPPDEITCGDYSWIPGSTSTVPDTANVERIDVEGMFPNPETGVTENRTFGGMTGITLNKNASGNLIFASVKEYSAITLVILNANVWSFVAKDVAGNFCPISMKPDVSAATSAFLNYFGSEHHFVPYVFGSDEYSSAERVSLYKATLDVHTYDFY